MLTLDSGYLPLFSMAHIPILRRYTMHVALCDDNTADRKQSERLLQRESLARIPVSGPLYVDSYGSAASLLAKPMQYDIFFLDICHSDDNAVLVAERLVQCGVKAPIVLVCSHMNYRDMDLSFAPPEQILFLDKPIRSSELAATIDHVLHLLESAEHTIELRSQAQTLYVVESDIMHAVQKGRNLLVTLASGEQILIPSTAENLYGQIQQYPCFMCPTEKTLVNARHIQKTAFRSILMRDGQKFRSSSAVIKYAQHMMKHYQ